MRRVNGKMNWIPDNQTLLKRGKVDKASYRAIQNFLVDTPIVPREEESLKLPTQPATDVFNYTFN
jgi:hypothetical protein